MNKHSYIHQTQNYITTRLLQVRGGKGLGVEGVGGDSHSIAFLARHRIATSSPLVLHPAALRTFLYIQLRVASYLTTLGQREA